MAIEAYVNRFSTPIVFYAASSAHGKKRRFKLLYILSTLSPVTAHCPPRRLCIAYSDRYWPCPAPGSPFRGADRPASWLALSSWSESRVGRRNRRSLSVYTWLDFVTSSPTMQRGLSLRHSAVTIRTNNQRKTMQSDVLETIQFAVAIRYDTLQEFNVDWKAVCVVTGQLKIRKQKTRMYKRRN